MRCPRCGYLSFDHLESCRKCHKPMAQGEQVGTAYLAAVPSFLSIQERPSPGSFDEEVIDSLDPDLDLLVDDDQDSSAAQEEDFEINFDAASQEGQDIDDDDINIDTSRFESVPVNMDTVQVTSPAPISIPEELLVDDDEESSAAQEEDFEINFDAASQEGQGIDDDDINIDTSRFESVPVNIDTVQVTSPAPISIPEELADISDLAPPVLVAEGGGPGDFYGQDVVADTASGSGGLALENAQMSVDDDLDLDGLHLSLLFPEAAESSSASGAKGRGQDDEFASLSLDDISLFGNLPAALLTRPSSPPPADDDLNFELDQGFFDDDQPHPSKKGVDDLSDINLSLDY